MMVEEYVAESGEQLHARIDASFDKSRKEQEALQVDLTKLQPATKAVLASVMADDGSASGLEKLSPDVRALVTSALVSDMSQLDPETKTMLTGILDGTGRVFDALEVAADVVSRHCKRWLDGRDEWVKALAANNKAHGEPKRGVPFAVCYVDEFIERLQRVRLLLVAFWSAKEAEAKRLNVGVEEKPLTDVFCTYGPSTGGPPGMRGRMANVLAFGRRRMRAECTGESGDAAAARLTDEVLTDDVVMDYLRDKVNAEVAEEVDEAAKKAAKKAKVE